MESSMEYTDLLQFFNGARWVRVPREFLLILPAKEAFILGTLMELVDWKLYREEDKDLWCRISVNEIRERIPYTPSQIRRGISTLKDKEFVLTKRVGNPSRRWMYVDLGRIHTEIGIASKKASAKGPEARPYLASQMTDPSPVRARASSRVSLKKHSNTIDDRGGRQVLHKGDQWSKLALALYNAVLKAKKAKKSMSPVKWGPILKRLHTVDGIEVDRIVAIMKWYCKRLKAGLPKYTPEAYSAHSFRDKFLRIESAKERQEDAEPEKVRLTSWEISKRKAMAAEMSAVTKSSDKDSFDRLVGALHKWQKSAKVSISTSGMEEGLSRLYLDTVVTDGTVFTGYALWIESQVRGWPNYGGDLMIFAPRGKHFANYMKQRLHERGMQPGESIRRLFSETK